ncbi:RNA polymerase sigma-54 factor [Neotabrizicola sp. sgz301269]|uniref:RNA polymerase factor sigma-54 n=1 Tax=Neotabrizicola sp. sgz301269 TaxID=3276282 RepID=UPI00376F97AE
MKSRPRITIAQTQRLSLNTALATSIRVLRADAAGLTQFLEEQAAENPTLVLGAAPPPDWLPRWGQALRALRGGGAQDLDPDEIVIAGAAPSLAAHVGHAIAALRLPPRAQRIADQLALALEPSGWLGLPLARIAAETGASDEEIEAVLLRLQELEPTGIFARDLAECLRLQAAEAGHLDTIMAGVLERLPLVAQGALGRLSRDLGCTADEVAQCIRRLRGYDPKPGARFQGGAAPIAVPDLVATRGGEGWQVALNRSALPTVTLAGPKGPERAAAAALIRMIEGRNATLLAVAREVLRRQEAVLEAGIGAVVPMTMADVAEALGLHQSTVSRVVAGAAVDTPGGTFWLRALFSPAVRQDGPAGAALRDALARMVAAEDPTQPLSDADLAQALAGAGAPLARRTVAKYRGILGIAPAHARRRRARR